MIGKDKAWITNCKEMERRLKMSDGKSDKDIMEVAEEAVKEVKRRQEEEEEDDSTQEFWDEMSGEKLDPVLVKAARKEEMEEFTKYSVYRKVFLQECYDRTGKAPIGVRWIDINKGGNVHPDYRSRLVAKEINTGKREDLFAATPPLEAKKALFSMAVTEGIGFKRGHRERGMKLDFTDVRRAYFNAKARRNVYVELPPEDAAAGMRGHLGASMYGTRDAAQNWEMEYVEFLTSIGFRRGRGSACVFWHREKRIRIVVHGDDFTCLGIKDALDWFRDKIAGRYVVKFRGRFGPEKDDDKSIRTLNRIVEWTDEGIRYEADQRHGELIVHALGLRGSRKAVYTPGVKTEDKQEDLIPLGYEDAIAYRSAAARGNCLAQDRTEILYASKEISRGMAHPTVGNLKALKRLGRYLKEKPRTVIHFDYQEGSGDIVVWSDTDYAGCKVTRKSTSGGVMQLGGHTVKGWASTQAVISLSSGEAEYYGMVKAATMGIGMRVILEDLGIAKGIKIKTDASAAKGMANRTGLGKVRHLEVSQLWLQEKVRNGDMVIQKIDGKVNRADALTKHLGRDEVERHCRWVNHVSESGRHHLAPEADCQGEELTEDDEGEDGDNGDEGWMAE